VQIRLWRRATDTVEILDLEEYLRGVIPAEMYTSWHIEALKAQAVAARTYAVRAISAPRHDNADLCDSAQCQAYSDLHYARTDEAVAATEGETWNNPGSYVSKCGRSICPYCNGVGGYAGITWYGRLCQYGAARCAEQGLLYHQILSLYYGDNTTIFIPRITHA
jgi:peptidoglycan hydrolase-like amidase